MPRITFDLVQALAAEKGVKLTRESDTSFYTGGGRRRRTNVITNSWYKLDAFPDKKFTRLKDVLDFLTDQKPDSPAGVLKNEERGKSAVLAPVNL